MIEHEAHDWVSVWPEINCGWSKYCRDCADYYERTPDETNVL